MRLGPSRRQSGRQRPRIEVGDGHVVGKVANQFYRGVGVDDLEKPAFAQLLAIAQMLGKGTQSCGREPFRVIVGLVDDVVGGFSEGLLGIVGYDQAPHGARESNVIGGPLLFFQFGDILIVYLAGRAWHGKTVTVASGASQGRGGKAAQPDRWMRFLNRLRRHLDVLEVEEFALEGDVLPRQSATNDLEGLVGTRSAFLEGHSEAVELFVFEADADSELETAAGDDIDYCNVLRQAHGIVKRRQEHAGCDANLLGTSGDRRGYRQDRGKVPVLDEVVLREPNVVESMGIAPCDLIEGFRVEAIVGLSPLERVAEVIPKTKAYFSIILTHGLQLLTSSPCSKLV